MSNSHPALSARLCNLFVLARLHKNHLKINLEKCVFGNKEVSYLGFTLTPDGIKPGKKKLKAIKDAKPPTDIKTI